MASIVFFAFIALSLYLALRAGWGRSSQSVHDFFVASRQFGSWFVFFLSAGEIYSIGTMVGFPGGIYAKGPTYGVWFLGYILLAYPIGYFLGPKIWEAGQRFNAITMPDLFKGYFSSRAVEMIVAASALIFLLPWGQLQFTGLVAALHGLGWNIDPIELILVSAVLAFAYIAVAGVHGSAYIAILKDILMVAAIVITGVAVAYEAGVEPVFRAASQNVPNTMNAQQLTFAMSTMLFQSLGFYLSPFAIQNMFTAKSPNTIRRAQVAMPLYMMMYPFLVVASCFAIAQNVSLASPNDAFFTAVVHLLPPSLVGLVAAGASLSGLLVLAGICLAIGPMVTRNLLPDMPEGRQKTSARIVIAIYLLVSIGLTIATPNLMLTLINMFYYGTTQLFPGIMAIAFGLRVNGKAIVSGLLVGQALAVALYVLNLDLGGFNVGLIALLVNIAVVGCVNVMSTRKSPDLAGSEDHPLKSSV